MCSQKGGLANHHTFCEIFSLKPSLIQLSLNESLVSENMAYIGRGAANFKYMGQFQIYFLRGIIR